MQANNYDELLDMEDGLEPLSRRWRHSPHGTENRLVLRNGSAPPYATWTSTPATAVPRGMRRFATDPGGNSWREFAGVDGTAPGGTLIGELGRHSPQDVASAFAEYLHNRRSVGSVPIRDIREFVMVQIQEGFRNRRGTVHTLMMLERMESATPGQFFDIVASHPSSTPGAAEQYRRVDRQLDDHRAGNQREPASGVNGGDAAERGLWLEFDAIRLYVRSLDLRFDDAASESHKQEEIRRRIRTRMRSAARRFGYSQ